MDKIMVFSTDNLFFKKLKKIVDQSLIFNDEMINLNVTLRYLKQEKPQILIIHESIKCQNVSKLIDYIIVNKVIPVIYIHQLKSFSQFYHVLNDCYFVSLEENKIEHTLPVVINALQNVKKDMMTLHEKLSKLETNLRETKLLSQAKMILMEQKQFKEDEAHKYILKEAMNRRMNKEEIAEIIIKKQK